MIFSKGDKQLFVDKVHLNGTWVSASVDVDEEFLTKLRTFYIEDNFGEHHHTIFVTNLIGCLTGLITHTLNVIVFSKTSLPNSLHILLLGLSAAEILQFSNQLSHVIHYFGGLKLYPFYTNVVFEIGYIFLLYCFSFMFNWIAAVAGIWHSVGITCPLQNSQLFSPCRANITISVIIVLSIMFSVPIFAFLTYDVTKTNSTLVYALKETQIDSKVINDYYQFQLAIYGLPIILMLVAIIWMSVRLRQMKRQKQRDRAEIVLEGERAFVVDPRPVHKRERKITRMLRILLVFTFLLSIIPPHISDFLPYQETNNDFHKRSVYLHMLGPICSIIKSLVIFITYYALDEFRKHLKNLFCSYIHARKTDLNQGQTENTMLEEGV